MEIKEILKIVNEIYNKKNEVDATDIYKAAGITAAEANAFITQMEEENLADVIEIDMCCGADYVVKGLTEKGKALISE
ncbi:MAG: hypothetical protein IKT48_02560 [Anaerotignum sp.]|nr:hypothetical protein [Anaerotignum sp.]MBR5793840.1 hypothetical protein [Anaerotignum sp.]